MPKQISKIEPDVMVVAVNGVSRYKGQFNGRYEGWDSIVNDFIYSCAPNDGIHHRRPAASLIAFYRTEDPMALTHWAKVRKITEDKQSRKYYLESLHQLPIAIKKGKIPPNMSGGCRSISFENLFKIKNMDELYTGYIQSIKEVKTDNEEIERCWFTAKEAIEDSSLTNCTYKNHIMIEDGEAYSVVNNNTGISHTVKLHNKTSSGFKVTIYQSRIFSASLSVDDIFARSGLLFESVFLQYLKSKCLDFKPILEIFKTNSDYMDIVFTFKKAFFEYTEPLSIELTEAIVMKLISKILQEDLDASPIKVDKPFKLVRVPGHEKLETRLPCFQMYGIDSDTRLKATGCNVPKNCHQCLVRISCKGAILDNIAREMKKGADD